MQSEAPDSHNRPAPVAGAREHALAIVLLLFGLLLVYGRAGELGFVNFDDEDYVLRTEWVSAGLTLDGVIRAFTEFRMSNWHPLTWISHMIDVSLFGLDPGPQHLVNVAFHGVVSALVYAFAFAVLRNWLAALVVAWLFLAHPLHVESVAWIAERKDLLCGLFFMLALLAWLRYAARPGLAAYLWVVGAFVLALLSKPMAVTLPIALLLLDFWPLGRLRQPGLPLAGRMVPAYAWLVGEKIPLFVLSLASGIVTITAQTDAIASIERVPVGQRLMNAVVAYVTYLRDTLAPTRLAMLYPVREIDPIGTFLPALLVVCALSALAIAWRRRWPWLLFGWLWFLLTLLPVIGLLQVGIQSHADRYMYLPSLGLFLAFGAVLARLAVPAARRALLALVPVLGFYSFIAWVQLGYWSGGYMAFSRVLEVAGDNFPAHSLLTGFHLREGRIPEAEAHARKALTLDSTGVGAVTNLGTVLLVKGDYAGAEYLFRSASSRAPQNSQILNKLGVALEEQGRLQEAKESYAAALKLDPKFFHARENLKRVGG